MGQGLVYIIESPRDLDLLDGRTEGQSLRETLTLAGIPHHYCLAVSKIAFRESLTTKLYELFSTKDPDFLPFLHISMHGNADGIELTSGEFLTWQELRSELSQLNNWMQGRLLICMSSCHGIHAGSMAFHDDSDYPFWALIGNKANVAWSDAAVAYITFYHLWFNKNLPFGRCLEAMRLASGDQNFEILSGKALQNWWSSNRYAKQLAEALRHPFTSNEQIRME